MEKQSPSIHEIDSLRALCAVFNYLLAQSDSPHKMIEVQIEQNAWGWAEVALCASRADVPSMLCSSKHATWTDELFDLQNQVFAGDPTDINWEPKQTNNPRKKNQQRAFIPKSTMISAIKFLGLSGKPPLHPTGTARSSPSPTISRRKKPTTASLDAASSTCCNSISSEQRKRRNRYRRRRRCAIVKNERNGSSSTFEDIDESESDSSSYTLKATEDPCYSDMSSVISYQSSTEESIASDASSKTSYCSNSSKLHKDQYLSSSPVFSPENVLRRSKMNNQRANALLSHMDQQAQIQDMYYGSTLLPNDSWSKQKTTVIFETSDELLWTTMMSNKCTLGRLVSWIPIVPLQILIRNIFNK